MLAAFILLAVALALAGAIARVVVDYRAAQGTAWQRVLAATRNSATVLWSYVVGAGGVTIAWADQAAQFLNAPEVTDLIQKHLSPTKVGVALTIIAIVTVIARLRTLVPAQ